MDSWNSDGGFPTMKKAMKIGSHLDGWCYSFPSICHKRTPGDGLKHGENTVQKQSDGFEGHLLYSGEPRCEKVHLMQHRYVDILFILLNILYIYM